MNDKAEQVATGDQDQAFLVGVEIFIDNKPVCEICRRLIQGKSLHQFLAHIAWHRMEKAVTRIHERNRVVRFTWVPSHTRPDDVAHVKINYP